MRRCVIAAAPAAVALALPLGAHASQPGVVYDPGSPSGKEYAIPLVSARGVGSGTGSQQNVAGIAFGSGIQPPGGGGGAHATGTPQGAGTGGKGSDGSKGSNGSKGSPGAKGSATATGAPAPLSPQDRVRLLRAEEPGGTGLLTIGIALAVLLPALLIAALLRRRPEQPAG